MKRVANLENVITKLVSTEFKKGIDTKVDKKVSQSIQILQNEVYTKVNNMVIEMVGVFSKEFISTMEDHLQIQKSSFVDQELFKAHQVKVEKL